MSTRHIHRGFTLAEMLAVVVILGLLSAVVLPQLGNSDDSKVASASRELVADLLYAQSCAIATGRMRYVVFDAVRGKYAVMDSLDPPGVILHPVEKAPYEVVIGKGPLQGVCASVIDFDKQTTLAFDALGTPYACPPPPHAPSPMNAGSIVLTSGMASRTIAVQPMSGTITVK